MRSIILTIFCLIFLLSLALGFVQNGSYYQIDYGDNYYLTETTVTSGRGGSGRVDLTGIENNIAYILSRLGNETNDTDLIVLINEIRNSTERLRNLTVSEISEMNEKIAKLFAEKKAPYLTTLSQPIYLELYPKEYTQSMVMIKNTRNETAQIDSSINGKVKDFINIENPSVILGSGEEGYVNLSIYILPQTSPGLYYGNVVMKSDNLTSMLPVNIRVLESREKILNIKVTPLSDKISPGETLKVSTTLYNLGGVGGIDVELILQLIDPATNNIITEETREITVETETTAITELNISENIREGKYVIRGIARFTREGGKAQEISIAYITIQKSFFQWMLFGIIPVWMLISVLIILLASYVGLVLYRREQAKKKRYLETLELRTLPQPGPRAGFIGRLAETAIRCFWNIDKLTTHVLVAGATGSGKTVAAQVLVEEALKRKAAVIVFDPTAQWTGFLRKNKDKGMFKLYPKFGMKKKEAQAFNGNIHLVKDSSERIDIKKHLAPGEITIFCLNNLETPEIDMVVRNSIQDAFVSGFEETYELRAVIIYDEVHRLLPKFGGSGSGLTQVEHAVREFRKWGLGVILVSQVLSDFVGEIKANVGTEIQMRTRYEDDLERIKMKYGEDILKSVIKASVGTGMMQNAEYNKGRPYFVTFRPSLHNLPRLSDKELNLYDQFNTKINELRKKLEELKEAEVDVFDIEIELNLAFDNVKKGSFDVAKMYLESLEPRINSVYEENKKKIIPKPKKEEKKGRERVKEMQERNADVLARIKAYRGEREKEEEKTSETSEPPKEEKKESKPPEREKPKEKEKKEVIKLPEEDIYSFKQRELEKALSEAEITDSRIEKVEGKEEHKKLKEKIEGEKEPKKADLSKVGRSVVTSEKESERGPQIKKITSRKNDQVFVYLTVKNNRRTPLRNIYITDHLPKDAEKVKVITHEDLEEQNKELIKWRLTNLGMREKRVLHYALETKETKLPPAELSWTEKENENWEDVKDVWKAIKDKKN